jgi:UDP-N-acetylglucosamine 2-epimerase (non-hydrolysing)
MITVVAGTRPNFMKVAPIHRALQRRGLEARLIHTGQHFDASMSEVFFRDLGLPAPAVRLHVGGGSHAEQTAAALTGIAEDLTTHRPSLTVVVGDVTSTLAGALAAAKLGVPVVHVEAGLRSRDWTMPEEINRVVTDHLADLLLISSHDARPNLLAEGIEAARIVFVGNVMIDSMHHARRRGTEILARHGLEPGAYAVATLHRPVNVDTSEALGATINAVAAIAARIPLVFPVHPRTLARAADLGLLERLRGTPGLVMVEPLGYDDFVTLMASAKLVATDSGGIQEETTALGIPCLTLREGTERPVTVVDGTNVITGIDPARIDHEVAEILAGRAKRGTVPEGWDGQSGERVAEALLAFLAGSPPPRTARALAA